MKNAVLLARLWNTSSENRFFCSGPATLAKLAALEALGFVKKYAGIDAQGARHFRITAAGKRALDNLPDAELSWFDRGYRDALKGRPSKPAVNFLSKDDYLRGYAEGVEQRQQGK